MNSLLTVLGVLALIFAIVAIAHGNIISGIILVVIGLALMGYIGNNRRVRGPRL